ncbi:uncharacterized protein hrob [Pholidichthys leucotaenia]
MTCKLGGLFSIGEDFDDEDLLETNWAAPSAPGPTDEAAAVSFRGLRSSSVAHRVPEKSGALCDGTVSKSSTAGQTVALGLRQLSSSSAPMLPALAAQQSVKGLQDDFDDWDVDLADLDECDSRARQPPQPTASAEPSFSAKTLRPSACAGIKTQHDRTLRELRTSSSGNNVPPCTLAARNFPAAPRQSPVVFPGLTVSPPVPGTFTRTLAKPQQPQKPCTTPRPSPHTRGLFETISPAAPSTSMSPHPLHTPVLTNRLVQLVSASSKLPKKRPRSEPHRSRTRRFPGPAGLLPQQPQGQNLDQIVVSVPQTPAHGVVARLPSQGSSSQAEEDEFSGGAWTAMKTEMGLDERNPSCFLHSYSVVMVLRKAALKQLARNKVPNMAVVLKSIIHTHADAKAVFKDPTGEIQGTVHRRLLEDRVEELKVGAVLLLKQVGVFSPSHRNHYLNVTPNNLLRIYAPNGITLISTQLPPRVLEPMLSSSPARSPSVLREPVSRMQLVFDEDDDEGKVEERRTEGAGKPGGPAHGSSRGSRERAGNPAPQDQGWDADDDLDELLGELPEDACNL